MAAPATFRRVLCTLVALLGGPALACSFAPGYETFQLGPVLRPSLALAPAPIVSVERIERGTKGDPGMCANAGILVLKVPTETQGYSFEIVEGAFDDVVPGDG